MSSVQFRLLYVAVMLLLTGGACMLTGADFGKVFGFMGLIIALDIRAKWLFAEMALTSVLKKGDGNGPDTAV